LNEENQLKQILSLSALITTAILISACSNSSKISDEQVFKALEKDPDRLLTVIEKAVQDARANDEKKQAQAIENEISLAIKNPLEPQITSAQIIRGPEDAPITIVEYSDFECPFCSRSKATLSALEDKYPGKIRLVFKHLPLSFHPNAMIAAKYYEAISLQSPTKAFEFHDRIFKNQSALKKGEAYLAQLSEELKVDMTKLNKVLHTSLIEEKIQADIAEANKFDFTGTPGFLVNGVPVKGAYPLQHFEMIITQLQDNGKLVL
tara:strand:+ start:15497 stop:16285 length:789 start_codon:yes stop_codon:yes gene_type:complete